MKADPFVPLRQSEVPSRLPGRLLEIIRERRLPYRLSRRLDHLLKSLGVMQKTVMVKGLKVRLRRLTTDEEFVQSIIVNEEYNPPGYEISEADTIIDVGG